MKAFLRAFKINRTIFFSWWRYWRHMQLGLHSTWHSPRNHQTGGWLSCRDGIQDLLHGREWFWLHSRESKLTWRGFSIRFHLRSDYVFTTHQYTTGIGTTRLNGFDVLLLACAVQGTTRKFICCPSLLKFLARRWTCTGGGGGTGDIREMWYPEGSCECGCAAACNLVPHLVKITKTIKNFTIYKHKKII